MRKVDFFIVGQPKSGTTALANFLDQHPEICMANPKEPGYFAKDFLNESRHHHGKQVYLKARTANEYQQHFTHCAPNSILGEATTTYLYSKDAAKNIHSYNPSAKIIILLRNPVDTLHSLHMQNFNTGAETERNFARALAKERSRKLKKDIPESTAVPSFLYYSDRIRYAEQIQRYFNYFSKNQILILTAEEFKKDNLSTYKIILQFLNVNDNFIPITKSINESAIPRLPLVHRLINSLALKNTLYAMLGPQWYTRLKKFGMKFIMKKKERAAMEEELAKILTELTRPEVKKVSELLDRNLAEEWGYGILES